MSDENNAPAEGANGTALPSAQPSQQSLPTAQPAPQPSATAQPIGITSEQLKQRLDEERNKVRESVLKEFGFATVADGKKALATLAEMQRAQMTEQERIQADLKAAQALAAQHAARSTMFESLVAAEFGKLPPQAQAAIDAQANGSADDRFRLMQFIQNAGFQFGAPSAQPSGAPQPNAAPPPPPPPANAGNVPPAPKPAPARSKFDEWVDKSKISQAMGDLFYQAHRLEIERTRPDDA